MAQNLELALRMRADLQQARRQLQQVEAELEDVTQDGARASRAMDGMQSSLGSVRTVALAVSSALAAMGIGKFARDAYGAISSSQSLQASLKTVTGSAENAAAAWDELLGFASETPFTLDQSVQAFIRMKSLGLDPTQASLRSFGNTASAMGKDMMQMVEAVADAATGEFERLKEFGIRASKEGEQITFTFQGIETTVANTAEAITSYLEEIGNTQFAGAMADQMDTLGGKASNLEDSIYQLYLAIGEAGATDAFNAGLDAASDATQSLTDNLDTLIDIGQVAATLFVGRFAGAMATATAAKLAATQQAIAYQAALARMAGVSRTAAAAQTALAGATRVAAGAFALIGGPVGAAVIAAAAIYAFRDELGLTLPKIDANTTAVNQLTGALDEMSRAEANLTMTRLVGQLAEVKARAEETTEAIKKVGQIEGNSGGFLGVDVTAQTDAIRELGQITGESRQEVADLEEAIALVSGRLGELDREGQKVEPTVTKVGTATSEAAREAEQAMNTLLDLNEQLRQQIATFGEGEAAVLEYRLTLGDLADDVARLGAEGEAMAAGIVNQAREIERLTEAEEARAEAVQQRQQAEQQAAENLQRVLDQVDPARALERQLELIEELKTQFPQYAEALDQAAGQVKMRIDEINQGLLNARNINAELAYGGTNAMMSFAEGIANGENAVDSLGDAMRRFFSDFLLYIAQAIAQQAIFNALQGATGGGGGGGVGGLIGTALGFLTGGGGGGSSAGGLYANIATYHGGGVIDGGMAGAFRGLAPDEVPAVFRRGEEVLTSTDPRHRDNQGGPSGANVSVKNVNVFDAGDVLDQAMADTAGQKVMLNYIKSNRSAVRGALGV